MAKHDEKKDKKRKRDLEREESNHRTTASNASYVDGHALDEIQYLEAKLILKPDRFTSVESFREFGKIVKRAAKETDVDFGNGQVGKCDVALWRTRGEHKPLVGEFAFQIRFERREDVHEKARKRAEQFLITLQQEAESWLSLGTTKTGMVYRLKGNAPQSHE